jgi:uncharacterized iron-regulated membrane protein
MNMRRAIRTVHAWGGLILGTLLLLSCLTGTLLLWKQEYLALVIPQARVEFQPTVPALAAIAEAVDRQFDANDILQIRFPSAEFPLAKVTLADTDYAYMDPAGNIVAQWHESERVEEWVYDLHHRLLLGNTGLVVTGVMAILASLLVLTGLYLYWPCIRKFGQGLRLRDTSRRALLLNHRNVGILVSVPLLLTLVTGATLAFPTQLENLLLQELRMTQTYSDSLVLGLDDITGDGTGNWLPAMERALATFPGGMVRTAQVPNAFSSYRIIGIQQPGDWSPLGMSRVYVDAEAGYMDIRIDSSRLPLVERSLNVAWPLHTGNTGGIWYKLWLTFVGFGTCWLVMIGMWSHARMLARRSN